MRTRKGTTTDTDAGHEVRYDGFAEALPYLYEFVTSDGHNVYLHEMDCTGIHFDPVRLRLFLTFECVESDLMEPCEVTMTFTQARIVEWRDDEVGMASSTAVSDERVRGQVSELRYESAAGFYLQTLDLYLQFDASAVACRYALTTSQEVS